MASLYADEDFRLEVVELLRRLGHDVVTVQEAGRSGITDAEVLADAIASDRAVLTYNRWDFERLHRQDPNHGGIVSCTPDDNLDALAARIDQAIAAADTLLGQHIRVN